MTTYNEPQHELSDLKSKQHSFELDGEDREPVRRHANQFLSVPIHWGLPRKTEQLLFYSMAILALLCLIASAALGSFRNTRSHAFIATISAAMVLHWAAWLQTAWAMFQRGSWTREETVVERVQFLFYAIRLQRLMIPIAIVSFVTFVEAYVRRRATDDLAYWLIYLLMFIFNTVFSVMNAYNNITWEADRLYYDDSVDGIPKVFVAILGI